MLSLCQTSNLCYIRGMSHLRKEHHYDDTFFYSPDTPKPRARACDNPFVNETGPGGSDVRGERCRRLLSIWRCASRCGRKSSNGCVTSVATGATSARYPSKLRNEFGHDRLLNQYGWDIKHTRYATALGYCKACPGNDARDDHGGDHLSADRLLATKKCDN